MKEQIISFSTAKLAKEKGFSEMCTAYYTSSTGNGLIARSFNQNKIHLKYGKYCSAPTQSLLQKWLREVHKVEIQIFTMGVFMDKSISPHSEFIVSEGFKKYCYGINVTCGTDNRGFSTYEEALEAGLNQALKLIKL